MPFAAAPEAAFRERDRVLSHGTVETRRHQQGRPTRSASTPFTTAPVPAYEDDTRILRVHGAAPLEPPTSPEPSLRVTSQSWNTSTPRGTVSDRQRHGRLHNDATLSRHRFRMVSPDSSLASSHQSSRPRASETSVPFKALGSAVALTPAMDAPEIHVPERASMDDTEEQVQQARDAQWMHEEHERHQAYAGSIASTDRRSHGARKSPRRRKLRERTMERSTTTLTPSRLVQEGRDATALATSDPYDDDASDVSHDDFASARASIRPPLSRSDSQTRLRAQLLQQQRDIEERKRRLIQEQREAEQAMAREAARLAELEREAAILEKQRADEREQRARMEREAAERERQQRALERLEQARIVAMEQERTREAERLELKRVRLENQMRDAAERSAAAKRAQQQALAAEAEREKRRLDEELAAEARRVQQDKERAEAARAAAEERERERQKAEEEAEKARLATLAREEQARRAALEKAERERAQAERERERLAAQEQEARERERLAALEAEREKRIAEERAEQARLAALARAEHARRQSEEQAERARRMEEEKAEKERLLAEEQAERARRMEEEKAERERLLAEEQAERARRMEEEKAERERLLAEEQAERARRIAEEQAVHIRRKEAAMAIQRAREAEQKAAEDRARAEAEAERERNEREARERQEQESAVQQQATREALSRAYAAREAHEAQRLLHEGRALRRARRDVDDEDRMVRTQTRHSEDTDDGASVAETEYSRASDATDASRLTHMLGRLRIVSRQEAPQVPGILTSAHSASQRRLRFQTPAPMREQSIRTHPALPWMNFMLDARVPRTAAPPSAVAPSYGAVQAVKDMGAKLRMSMLSMHSLDSAMPDEAWAVRPIGPYRDGAVRYLPGFTVHGLAEATLPPAARSGDLLFTEMPSSFVLQLLSHLDFADIRALLDVSRTVRQVLEQPEVHDALLVRFLGPVGYASGAHEAPGSAEASLPLTLYDVEGFLLYLYGCGELFPAAHAYLTTAHHLDRRLPRLARTMVRSYNRVLAHVRLQPRDACGDAWEVMGPDGIHAVQVASLVTPGLVSMFLAWAPAWASDVAWLAPEVQRVERELFLSGIWRSLRKGDVAINMATDARFVFNGQMLMPLATEYDAQGHLPSWLNALRYAPTYYDPALPPTNTPVMYLDVRPWRDQIVTSLQLLRDNIERQGANRQLYRISKWVYRAAFTVSVPLEGAPDWIESAYEAHPGWNGTVIIDIESTAEHVARFLERCRYLNDPSTWVADVLSHVLDSTNAIPDVPVLPVREELEAPALFPFYLLRDRSRAGLAWLVPA